MTGKELQKKLGWEFPDIAKKYPEQLEEAGRFCEGYKEFLNEGKTERECVKSAVVMAEAAGYRHLAQVIKDRQSLKAGDRVYAVSMEKPAVLFHLGTQALGNRMNLLAAHLATLRRDWKQ